MSLLQNVQRWRDALAAVTRATGLSGPEAAALLKRNGYRQNAAGAISASINQGHAIKSDRSSLRALGGNSGQGGYNEPKTILDCPPGSRFQPADYVMQGGKEVRIPASCQKNSTNTNKLEPKTILDCPPGTRFKPADYVMRGGQEVKVPAFCQ